MEGTTQHSEIMLFIGFFSCLTKGNVAFLPSAIWSFISAGCKFVCRWNNLHTNTGFVPQFKISLSSLMLFITSFPHNWQITGNESRERWGTTITSIIPSVCKQLQLKPNTEDGSEVFIHTHCSLPGWPWQQWGFRGKLGVTTSSSKVRHDDRENSGPPRTERVSLGGGLHNRPH